MNPLVIQTNLGIEPTYKTYKGNDPLGFVIGLNLNRRQLSSSQKSCIALEILDYEEKLAKQRQLEAVHKNLVQYKKPPIGELIPQLVNEASTISDSPTPKENKPIKRAPKSTQIVADKFDTKNHQNLKILKPKLAF